MNNNHIVDQVHKVQKKVQVFSLKLLYKYRALFYSMGKKDGFGRVKNIIERNMVVIWKLTSCTMHSYTLNSKDILKYLL